MAANGVETRWGNRRADQVAKDLADFQTKSEAEFKELHESPNEMKATIHESPNEMKATINKTLAKLEGSDPQSSTSTPPMADKIQDPEGRVHDWSLYNQDPMAEHQNNQLRPVEVIRVQEHQYRPMEPQIRYVENHYPQYEESQSFSQKSNHISSQSHPPKMEPRTLTHAELADKRQKRLCYWCDEPYNKSHNCEQRKSFNLQVLVGEDDEEFVEALDAELCHMENMTGEKSSCTLAVNGLPISNTFKLHGWIKGQEVLILLDSGRGNCRGMDSFNKLPNEHLVSIISLLPFKEAVRTCVLSKRWRYLHALMPNIILDPSVTSTTETISRFVNCLLVTRKGTGVKLFVDTLCILQTHLKPLPIERWLQDVAWHGIRELEIRSPFTFVLPASLFTINTLEVLILESQYFKDKEFRPDLRFEVPAKVSLPNLKILRLQKLRFADNDALNRIVYGCYALEELICYLLERDTKLTVCSSTLKCLDIVYMCPKDWSGSFDIVINVPNLEVFRYTCNFLTSQSIVLGPSLARVVYRLEPRYRERRQYIDDVDAVLRSINSTRTLRISDVRLKEFRSFNIALPVFGNMKHLVLSNCMTGLVTLPCLLARCESLEVLELASVSKWRFDRNAWAKLEESRSSCLTSRLKTIKFIEFKTGKDQLELAGYFLKSARVLKRMEFYMCEDINHGSSKIPKLPRVSKECKIMMTNYKGKLSF